VLDKLKRRLFFIVARTCFTLYGWFPLFGTLRASLGIIRQDGKFLVIHRNDGRGLCLPGGLSAWREAEEETLRREVEEETGLTVSGNKLLMHYHCTVDFPADIAVFEVQATGELKDSWEGSPRWMTVDDLEPGFVRSQRRVIEVLRKMSAGATDSKETE
jgi:8-oxo-dGTP pyrophosphatase MutT (NUDIX family)